MLPLMLYFGETSIGGRPLFEEIHNLDRKVIISHFCSFIHCLAAKSLQCTRVYVLIKFIKKYGNTSY